MKEITEKLDFITVNRTSTFMKDNDKWRTRQLTDWENVKDTYDKGLFPKTDEWMFQLNTEKQTNNHKKARVLNKQSTKDIEVERITEIFYIMSQKKCEFGAGAIA